MIEYILFMIGFVLLIKGADWLVDGASLIASKLGISQLIIGLTIVAFGTSAPELVVGVISSLEGNSEIILGNVIGSNVSNILLILGAAAIIHPLKVRLSTVWKEIPFSLLAALLLLALVSNSTNPSLSFYDGITMYFIFALFLYYTFSEAMNHKPREGLLTIEKKQFYKSIGMVILGIIGLFLGGKWVVEGAVYIAQAFGFSEFLISATIIAIGTSLPELAVAIMASLKRKLDIAIGNIVGSNIFNILLILGTSSIIAPIAVPSFAIADISFLIYMTVLLFTVVYIGKDKKLSRVEGLLFITLYIGYILFLIFRG